MSEFGIKIKNIVAGSIYECNLGVRDNLDTENAMIANSLLLDFLLTHGLNVWNGESTRDLIGITFDYGSKSYEEDKKHVLKMGKLSNEKKLELLNRIETNKDKYDKKTKSELRTMFYVNGVDVTYNTWDKHGKIIKYETIHYKMLFRTPGKAKKGVCMFIRDSLYDVTIDYLRMGIKLPDENAPLVEIGAYSSLVASGIVGRVKIEPENILVVKDFDSYFVRDVVSVETNSKKQCVAFVKDNYELKNTMFDGQALIDDSIFPVWGDGYILLRQHMTKMAAFRTYIQKYYKDYFGDEYETAELTDLWGNKHLAKDIVLITTENAMKWLKFGVSYEYWCNKVHENGCLFGVVKTAHKSKLGSMQRMSYQMVNSLNMATMDEVLYPTVQYIKQLQRDNKAFLQYLERNKNFSNDFEVLIALVKQDPDFVRSEYFRQRKKIIIREYLIDIREGKILQNGDNLVIVGSPYAMLMRSVGLNPEDDPTFTQEDGCTQCYTARFENDEYLAGFRSPHNSQNNIDYLHNHYHQYFTEYFNLGKQIIAVNMRHTDFQDRSNGSDQDSDSLYVTNNHAIVQHAKWCYKEYPTIVNNVPKEKNHYRNALEDFAEIDNKLARAQMAIGSSSNYAQIALSYSYTKNDRKTKDLVCILSVLAQIAIDNAKRTSDIDLVGEISRIRNELDIKNNHVPQFWESIEKLQAKKTGFKKKHGFDPDDGDDKETKVRKEKEKQSYFDKALECPMNILYNFQAPRWRSPEKTIPNAQFFNKYELKGERRTCRKVEELIEKYSWDLYQYNRGENDETGYLLLRDDFDKMEEDIKKIHPSNNYLGLMSFLIDRALNITDAVKHNQKKMISKLFRNQALLMKALYVMNPQQFLQCWSKNVNTRHTDNK